MDFWNLIPWSISLASVIILLVNQTKNGKKDTQAEEARFARLNESLLKANMKLDTVCATTNETRADIKSLNAGLGEVDKRVSVMERDLQTAFMRIDELREQKADK